MSLVNGLAHQESLVAHWLERPNAIWEAMGLIPVGDSDFLLLCLSFFVVCLLLLFFREILF